MSTSAHTSPCTACPSRRAVLAGIGATATVLATSGCSVYGRTDTSQQPAAQPPAAAAAASPGNASPGPAQSGVAQSGAERLASLTDVPVGGGVILAEQRVVLTRPAGDEVRGFSAVCTHAGCTVGEVDGGLIRCPCHGSAFSIADGSVQAGPAPSPLPQVAVAVSGADVVRA